ncbi:HDIG domain-containing metalloprotein [Anaerosacchariphilus polymeriproducens]|uniref:HDIG domain-containing protein n=1 Tax=Anaerosacchariphilus polymeriproducens TaxID=1812858 RepID=A0A371ASJ6_9FIRM|nr:HDIG domain-containing metalloprotein [Anaerosacchariphilus polymeriproducens]RDU22531.1 HDIG domain-containing protein [Anaerosacchariphilus polymeriproducens]
MLKEVNDKQIMKLFHSINGHLLQDDKPSEYLTKLSKDPEFNKYPYNMLLKLKTTEQSKVHHPEGNVWNHTLMVVDEAAKRKTESKDEEVFMWTALLHDIGKPETTKIRKGRITAYDHDKVGAKRTKEFLSAILEDRDFIQRVSNLVKYHMQVLYVLKDLPYKNVQGMQKDTDISEVALIGLCDRLGRTGSSEKEEEENIKLFIEKCKKYQIERE